MAHSIRSHSDQPLHALKARTGARQVAAIVSIVAIALICVDSAQTIRGILAGTFPTVTFNLGTAYRDLNYCGSQTLDLYVPSRAAHPLPLAVFVHGGGMTAGDKTNVNPTLLTTLAASGFAVASVNYRLAPQFKFPAQLEDLKCAIRFLRTQAQTYGLNGREIFAFGTSVGGQLVALAALTGPHSAFDVGPYLEQTSRVAAVVDMFGPANLTEGLWPTMLFRAFGSNYSQSDLLRASPTNYVAANAPPILIIQGAVDGTVPESQSTELYDDLTAAGDPAQLVLVQNMGHMFVQVGSKPIDPSLQQIGQDMVRFFEAHGGGS